MIYFAIAALWILLCLSIGFYINGKGLKEKSRYKIGFIIIGLSYLSGIALLLFFFFN
jgi:hypothetical protein